MANRTRFAGQFNAVDYAYGCPGADLPGGLVVDLAPSATGAGTLTLAFGQISLTDGTPVAPLATTAPITVGTGSNAETVTPSAVGNANVPGYDVTTVTATFSNLHGRGDLVSSGTFGLQEAINDANSRGGGVVIVDAKWFAIGGTNTILNAATLPSNGTVSLLNSSSTGGGVQTKTVLVPNAQVLTLNSVGVALIPAPGAGNMISVDSMVIENVFLTAAFAAGGAIQASYGTGVTIPATATIAATFLTSPTASQVIKVAGALASNLSSAILNVAVRLAAATADFTTGGGSLIVKVQYRVLTGF